MGAGRASAFAPIADDRTRLLILGSLPGRISLAEGRYYANPRNQFWRLVGALTGYPLPELDYPTRLDILRDCGIGLWDVVQSAERRGSLDAAIRSVTPNALTPLALALPALRAVAFNGAKSAAIGRRELASCPDLDLFVLPSSSPACTTGFDGKLAAWRALEPYVQCGARSKAQ